MILSALWLCLCLVHAQLCWSLTLVRRDAWMRALQLQRYQVRVSNSTCICTCIGIGDIVGNNFVRAFVSAAVLQSQELGQELVEMVDSLADTLLLNMVAGEPSQEVYGLAVSDSDSVPLNRLNAFVYGSQVSSATGPSIILTLQRVRDAASLVSELVAC